ncbi:LytR/AlgR family response regulator transcription factor [Enterococcus caccae]|uniref:Response regulator n=1 Tax=Enterococcus caccae ATCC BAA-1240 TaxID=1158612 RepID=R3TSJ9_9ENTE|nr:LytTR family DNA-binding domain-containing protein [Enterococcus caccae]EOL44519.1 hypothetical protein UC7_02061 [Enterococcus caccae ATCC BAA-1240]EOT58662.1 hypothetical protein I580_02833 [Enterococcus caccae ATCC BAA-1240]OJG23369.1 hypothetical protein RU98_GL001864 [Enterococcus caccae]
MLSIFICEDETEQRKNIERYVKNTIMIEDYDMELVISSADPHEILEFVKTHPKTTGLYFLDVDLKHEMSGIALASEIREQDDLGKIVFVTTHAELSYLTFTYKVEAMDYIIKDHPEHIQKRIQECVHTAFKRYKNDRQEKKNIFKINVGDKVHVINHEDILFFETSPTPHKIILHLDNSQLEFYGAIKELVSISDDFYRCHKSFVINKKNIKKIHKKEREVEMNNGEICYISTRFMKNLIENS